MLVRGDGSIKEIHDIRAILNLFDPLNTWLILDLDNTVIESRISFGGDQWFTQLMSHASHMPDKDKAIALIIDAYHAAQHHVRVKEVDPAIINIIKAIQDIGVPIIALTARGEPIIEATIRQLQDIGIDFARNSQTHSSQLHLGSDKNKCCYFNGIIYCSGNDKGKCLSAFLEQCEAPPSHVIMIDDKEKYLLSVKQAVEEFNIGFNGLRYGLLDEKVKQHDQKIAHKELSYIVHKFSPHVRKAVEKLNLLPEKLDSHPVMSDAFFDKLPHNSLEKKPLIMMKPKKPVFIRSSSAPRTTKLTEETLKPIPLFRQNTLDSIKVHRSYGDIFQKQSYSMLTHDTPITPSSKLSCRGSDRESILLNMKSPALKTIFDAFMKEMVEKDKRSALPPPYDADLMQRIISYVSSHLKSISEEKINQLIVADMKKAQSSKKQAPLEWFWKQQSGCCRHHALAVAHLLVSYIDYYAKQHGKRYADTNSRVYRFRTRIPSNDLSKPASSHGAVIYEAENGHRYLLDSTRMRKNQPDLVVDLTDMLPADKPTVAKHYLPYNGDYFIDEITAVYDELRKPVITDERVLKKPRLV